MGAIDSATCAQPINLRIRPPRAAYIHVPFCQHRCGYCNFTLVAGRDDLIGDYLRAIDLELSRVGAADQNIPPRIAARSASKGNQACPSSSVGAAHHANGGQDMVGGARPTPREVDTLYFGGGTPTHLSPEQFKQLAATALKWHPLANGYEWTVEANPADLDRTMMDTLTDLGVTRLSLGGQSFRAEKLRLLERDHAAADIERSIAWAQDAGMQVSLDLIFATPCEMLSQWQTDLDAAIALEPDHISTYGLTFEQGTAFWNRRLRGELAEADEELQREMYALAIDRLAAAGYEHYEVSSFALPGRRSRHNQVYWSGDGYFAAGPGAARYVGGVRETNHRSTTTYLNSVLAGESPVAEREQLSPEARAHELVVFSLRRMEGVSRRDFATRTGLEVDELVGPPLEKFIGLGLLADDGDRIRLTREGLFVSDAMWPEML